MQDLKKHVRLFKALGDENRLQILQLLSQREVCACAIERELSISQSTLSHHMKVLTDAGIVKGRKDGRWIYYSVDEAGRTCVQSFLAQLSDVTED
ncbi:ArsR/SmtB family transcription factor [Butyricicoccus sp.]|uniref:ArsR/SmtB family transcription factor n=1 Tax=Butyricicoccus sp. TaxID=2049021 RepID=UPI003F17D857